jgi:hypothetical protein
MYVSSHYQANSSSLPCLGFPCFPEPYTTDLQSGLLHAWSDVNVNNSSFRLVLAICVSVTSLMWSVTQVVTIGLRQLPSLSEGTQQIGITLRASKSGEPKKFLSSCKARRIDQIKAGLSTVIHGKYIYMKMWVYCLICLRG